MQKKLLAVQTVAIVILIVAIGTRGHASVPGKIAAKVPGVKVGARCQDGPCFPGTEPRVEWPRHIYLPLVCAGDREPQPPRCDPEVEGNDVHTNAQVVAVTCIAGDASGSGDGDWYRLAVCSPASLSIELAGPDSADLDLYLHGDPPGWPLYSSEGGGTSAEAIEAADLVTGTYYTLVQSVVGAGGYTLSITASR